MRFKLFGESLFSLCLVPMFFYCAATWMVFQFNRKFFSERAACLSAALMAFAPLDVQGFDLYPYAHKAAVGTYSMAAMILFFHMLEKEGREKLVCAAAFGLLSGVGLLNSEAYGMSLAFLAAAWICSDRGLHRKPEFLAFLTAFSVGFIPYLMLELRPFLARVLTGGFAGSFDRPPGLLSTLRVLSILAWPFREVLGEITGFLAGTAAFAVMIPGLMGKPGRSRLALRVLAGVVAGYAGVMIALGVGTRYYVFPAFAPAMALLGVALGAILERLSRGGGGGNSPSSAQLCLPPSAPPAWLGSCERRTSGTWRLEPGGLSSRAGTAFIGLVPTQASPDTRPKRLCRWRDSPGPAISRRDTILPPSRTRESSSTAAAGSGFCRCRLPSPITCTASTSPISV